LNLKTDLPVPDKVNSMNLLTPGKPTAHSSKDARLNLRYDHVRGTADLATKSAAEFRVRKMSVNSGSVA